MHNGNPQSIRKMRLGSKTIDPSRVSGIKRVGSRVCILKFITGELISVTCGIEVPDSMRISFPGTPERLKALLSSYIDANRQGRSVQDTPA